jgi:mercuric ion binding protein
MRRSICLAAAALVLGGTSVVSIVASQPASAQSASAQAAVVRTTVFAVKNMTCPVCPITVKTAMGGVKGVQSVKIDFDAKTATVVFDPSVATVEAIAAASADVGYPATVAQIGN